MRRIALFAVLAACSALPAAAQQREARERPPALTRVLDCRALASAEERLACFDREVAALEAAERAQDLVVVDRQQLRRTRRSLFGLTLPNLSVFGDDGPDEEGMSQIESTIRGFRQDPYGKYTFVLEDGARWVQIDSRELRIEPRVGQPIRIRRAAMGSYLANVNNQIAIRVRRER